LGRRRVQQGVRQGSAAAVVAFDAFDAALILQIAGDFVMNRIAKVISVTAVLALVGCNSLSGGGSNSASSSAPQVGHYTPPQDLRFKPTVSVPVFTFAEAHPATQPATTTRPAASLGDRAADEMASLLNQSGRFAASRPGPAATDFILVGTIDGFQLDKKLADPNAGNVMDKARGLFDRVTGNQGDPVVVAAACNITIELKNPQTGDVVLSHFSEFRRSGPPASLDLASNAADRTAVSDDDRGRVLRVALDDALRKSLAKVDRFIASLPPPQQQHAPVAGTANLSQPSGAGAAAPATTGPAPVAAPTARLVTCPNCGNTNPAGAAFCSHCGAKLPTK
jgi:hypothetical protein